VEVHKTIAALGMFNVTNQYTFGAIFQRDMGARGDVGRRREMVAEVILSYLEKQTDAGRRNRGDRETRSRSKL